MRWGTFAAVCLAALALCVGTTQSATTDGCGLPASGPLWVDYAGHDAPIIPKPGLVLAVSSGTEVPAAMRAAGAATIMFDLHLNDRVGTPSKPADPTTITVKAKRLFDFAVQVSGCQTPLIALNELFGAQTPVPWTPTIAQYRANVLALVQALDDLGATTAITIANPPFTGGEAADWWREAAKASILVRQVYFTSPGPKGLYAMGPERASRSMRQGMRALIAKFGQIGIPASRVALELQFQSAPGTGGRQGLQPRAAWLEFVKLQALAAKQVAAETKIEGVWSWGWPSFSEAGVDPDKPAAACVYLWARSPSLCDAPSIAGPGFNTSRTEGQLSLPAAVRCTFAAGRILKSDVARTGALTGDLDSAATALLQRVVLRAQQRVDPVTVLSAERAIVRDRFGGSIARYRAAVAAAHITLPDARAIVADRLARELVEARFKPQPPTGPQIADFLGTYASTQVRLVSVEPRAPWLGDASRGFAVATLAPAEVFDLPQGKRRSLDTVDGRFAVRALGPALPLYALAPSSARDVARGLLGRFAKQAVYDRWLRAQQVAVLKSAACARDLVPVKGDVDLTAWAPFLG